MTAKLTARLVDKIKSELRYRNMNYDILKDEEFITISSILVALINADIITDQTQTIILREMLDDYKGG